MKLTTISIEPNSLGEPCGLILGEPCGLILGEPCGLILKFKLQNQHIII